MKHWIRKSKTMFHTASKFWTVCHFHSHKCLYLLRYLMKNGMRRWFQTVDWLCMWTHVPALKSLSPQHKGVRFEADQLPLCNQWKFHSTDRSKKLAVCFFSVNQFLSLVLPLGVLFFFCYFFWLLQNLSLLAAITRGRPFDLVSQTATPAGSFNAFSPTSHSLSVARTYTFFSSFHSLAPSVSRPPLL